MLTVQKSYTPADGRVFRHKYVFPALPGGTRSIPAGMETSGAAQRYMSPCEYPVEGTTSAFSLTPQLEPASRATLEPMSPV
jgi:hypothetical protein